MECGNIVAILFKSSSAEKSDHGHRWLLRARCVRPYRYTAEKRDELAPSHHLSPLGSDTTSYQSALPLWKRSSGGPMSALGQKQTHAVQQLMSALPPIATAKATFHERSCPLYP